MNVHLEVLGTRQQRVLHRLGPLLTPRRFYLGGGTALALHLGHRRSVDLDWFTANRITDPLRLAQNLREPGGNLITEQTAAGTWHGRASGVRVTLLEYRYPLLQPLLPWPACGCELASLEDLAAMKLSAVADRGAKKDFVDLYALASQRLSLGQILDGYQRKFSVTDIVHVLYSLTYFDDADPERMPRMLWDIDWRTIKKTIRQWVQETTG